MSRNLLFGLFSLLVIAGILVYDRIIDPDKPHKTGSIELTVTEDEAESDASSEDVFGGGEQEVLEPVHWSLVYEPVNGDTIELTFVATIDDGWYVYSHYLGDDGPIPTNFYYDDTLFAQQNLVGGPIEDGDKVSEGMDALFGMEIKKFGHQARFIQRMVVTDPNVVITGEIEYMTCDAEKCLFPQPLPVFHADIANNVFWAGEEVLDVVVDTVATNKYGFVKDLNNPVNRCGIEPTVEDDEAGQSLWSIFILGLFGGFIALLTPCVFPMIPLTVSFFTKGGSAKGKGLMNASLYGFFIFLIYILLSVPFHLLDNVNPDILNEISTNVILNVVFFVIFVVFAFSFFGYFELTMPASLTNKMDSASDVGGVIGIFFMAVTLALVSFSCTGPILGSLLAGALTADGGAWQLTSGMAGFGLALALPFSLFAAFPGLLKSLPKSGGWLNSVKVVIAFAELALAAKFFSNADLVQHWGLLKREMFFAIWILSGTGIFAYLVGWLKFPHDSPITKLGPIRISTAVLVLAFVLYLVPGLTNTKYANVKLISGFPPPMFYSIYDKSTNCPLGLNCYKEFETGKVAAEIAKKPILLDFTGWACTNCRKMEENVWVDPLVFEMIDKNYTLISLYVDDKTDLPLEEQDTVIQANGLPRILETVGNKWSFFQTHNFSTNSQPYYVLIHPNGTLLTVPVGYTPDAEQYLAFLQCGLDAFNEIEAKEN